MEYSVAVTRNEKPRNGSLITMTANSTSVWMSAPPQRTKSASEFISKMKKMDCGKLWFW